MKDKYTKTTYILLDVALAIFSVFFAAYLKYDAAIPDTYTKTMLICFLLGSGTVVLFGLLLGSYSGIWKFTSLSDALRQAVVTLLSGCTFMVAKVLGLSGISGSITVICCGLFFLLSCGTRLLPRLLGRAEASFGHNRVGMKKVVIIGAGAAGSMIVKRLRDNARDGYTPVAFLDDDPKKHGLRVNGIPVCGGCEDMDMVMKRTGASELIIAIPSITPQRLQQIHTLCVALKYPVKIFRSVEDADSFNAGTQSVLDNISIEDLLFRDSIRTDMSPVYAFLTGKTVLVTGGAGSIGSELCRQLLEHGCQKLIVFDIHENGLYELNEELKLRFDPSRYVLCVGSVRDPARLDDVFATYQPDFVLHAAAHKHVPMMELNPGEAIKNNIVGTRNVLHVCAAHHVKRFVLISTDKAVNPTNVMGATKRVAELLVQSMNGRGGCEMTAVRFGNVLGSNGSVIPLFKKQIAAGGPVTVTHLDMTRYFMTIPEAVSLVLSAGALARGGELFVLDMGHPVKIYDLAENLITLSGHTPGKDIQIVITGLRPGEKMYEEITLSSESIDATSHEKIFTVHAHSFDQAAFQRDLASVIQLAVNHADAAQIQGRLLELVRFYSKLHQNAEMWQVAGV